MSERRTGRTTKQIAAAGPGAVFIVPAGTAMRDYARYLAAELGRTDIQIITFGSVFEVDKLRGVRHLTQIVVDHSTPEHLSAEAYDALCQTVEFHESRRATAQGGRP